LGFATGSTGLHARLTVRETLLFFGRLHGLAESDLPRRIQTVSEALDLGALLARRCDVLSTGQKQRVTLARAAIADPPVLVLDEPTLGLDVLASQGLRRFMRDERERGKAVLFSTHYLTEAELLCDRVGVLHDGKLLAEGSPQALKEQLGAASLEEAFLRLVAGLRHDAARSEPARGETEEPASQENRDRE
jgi:sodium transport system ATP-binding protein